MILNKKSLFILISMFSLASCITPGTPTSLPPRNTLELISPTHTQIPPTQTLLTGCSKSNVRVRTEPNTSSVILTGVPSGTCITIIGINSEKTWVKVIVDKITGWVSIEYITVNGDINLLSSGDNSQFANNSPLEILPASPPTSIPTQISQKTNTPQPTQIPQKINTPRPVATKSTLLCKDTGSHIGEYITCKIPKAYCSYQPGISGSPTFCNDAQYPNNNFTLVIWGSDFSRYDNECIVVSGLVSRYKGKPQIEAQSQPQATFCQ